MERRVSLSQRKAALGALISWPGCTAVKAAVDFIQGW
jgi:hypothetical protein